MKCGDVMAALRACPGGMPLKIKVGKDVYEEGVVEMSDEGVSLVVKVKTKGKKK